MFWIFISRSTARWLFLIVIAPNCSCESLQTAVQSPLGPTLSRLRVVPHFSSGIVERAKHERTWKSPHTRKGNTQQGERKVSPFLAWGDFHAHSRFARSTIPEEKWGTTRSLNLFNQSHFWLMWLKFPIEYFSNHFWLKCGCNQVTLDGRFHGSVHAH